MDLNARLRDHVAHHYQNASAFRDLLDSVGLKPGDIHTTADLSKVPVTSKETLQEKQAANPPFGGFVAVPIHQLHRVYLSPGPIYDPHGHDERDAQLSAEQAFREIGIGPGDIVVNTFMYHMVPAGLLMDAALSGAKATVIPMGPGNTEVQIKVIMDTGANAYIGTPSFLELILDKCPSMGVDPKDLPIKKAIFSAEPYFPAQRKRFEQDHGMTTAQLYATADIGIISYEIPGKTGMYVPSNLIVQVCSPETGEELPHGELGEVVVTTFSPTYALIRFGTGDLSIMDAEGDRLKLRGWMGRSGEAVKVRGMFLHPNSIRAALAPYNNIKQFQAVIGREGARDTVRLELILTEGTVDGEAIKKGLTEAARLSVNEVAVVESIEGSRLVRDARNYN
jgi:phenylacetate-CoA ligase